LGDRLAPRFVAVVLGVGLQGPGVLGVPDVTENRSQRAQLTPPCAPEGACQSCSRERRSPSSVALPAPTPSFARPSSKPASTRETSLKDPTVSGPRLGWMGSPSRIASTTLRIDSGVWLSKYSQLIITTGAKSQAALHSMRSKVILPSSVVSSWPMPSRSEMRSKMPSPPMTAHSVFVHTPTVNSPFGRRLYWE